MNAILRSLVSRAFLRSLMTNTLAQGVGFGLGYGVLKAWGMPDEQALPTALPLAFVMQMLLWVVEAAARVRRGATGPPPPPSPAAAVPE